MALRFGLLLMLAVPLQAGIDPAIVEFRLRDTPKESVRGWLTARRPGGFEFERFGARKSTAIAWDDLVESDSERLRQRFGLLDSAEEEAGLVDGARLHLAGGGAVEGVLEKVDERGRHWLRQRGLLMPYPQDRIEKVVQVKLRETDVFDEEQVYLRHIHSMTPRTAEDHLELANRLLALGNFENARLHFTKAVEEKPELRWRATAQLEEIERSLADRETRSTLRKARRLFALDQRFDEARALLMKLMDEKPGARRSASRLIDEIEKRMFDRLKRRYHAAKEQELCEAIRLYLLRKTPTLEQATRWAVSTLPGELRERIARRLDLDEPERKALEETRATGTPHWANYWSGSFILSKRARIGRSTQRRRRGDPEAWWRSNPGVASRSSFLRAYVAERVPALFEVVQVKFRDCVRCGGTGVTRQGSFQSTRTAGNEWKELCTRCFGATRDRIVAYR